METRTLWKACVWTTTGTFLYILWYIFIYFSNCRFIIHAVYADYITQHHPLLGKSPRLCCQGQNPPPQGAVHKEWQRAHEEAVLRGWLQLWITVVLDQKHELGETLGKNHVMTDEEEEGNPKLCCCWRSTCVVEMSRKLQDASKRILISTMNLVMVIESMHEKTDEPICKLLRDFFTSFVITIKLSFWSPSSCLHH